MYLYLLGIYSLQLFLKLIIYVTYFILFLFIAHSKLRELSICDNFAITVLILGSHFTKDQKVEREEVTTS